MMEEIWLRFEKRLRLFIKSKVHDEHITEDILQDLFVKIHANVDGLKDKTKIQSWIYQICRNLIQDHFRKQKKEYKGIYADFDQDDDQGEDYMAESVNDMIQMMDDMPAEYCEAICLTELEGLSQKEYAEKIGISYSGAKSRVQRARQMLKDMLMKCCHYEFDKYGTVIGISPIECCCCEH